MKIKVYHREKLPHPLDLNHCRDPGWPKLYTHVAGVETSACIFHKPTTGINVTAFQSAC